MRMGILIIEFIAWWYIDYHDNIGILPLSRKVFTENKEYEDVLI